MLLEAVSESRARSREHEQSKKQNFQKLSFWECFRARVKFDGRIPVFRFFTRQIRVNMEKTRHLRRAFFKNSNSFDRYIYITSCTGDESMTDAGPANCNAAREIEHSKFQRNYSCPKEIGN